MKAHALDGGEHERTNGRRLLTVGYGILIGIAIMAALVILGLLTG